MDTVDNLLTTREVAELLGVTDHAVRQWRKRKQGPRYIKLGVNVIYRRRDIEAWQRKRAS